MTQEELKSKFMVNESTTSVDFMIKGISKDVFLNAKKALFDIIFESYDFEININDIKFVNNSAVLSIPVKQELIDEARQSWVDDFFGND